MSLPLGWIAALLVGAVGPADADLPTITYEIKFVDLAGLEWRATSHSKMTQVAQQGANTIWTAPGDVVQTIVAKSRASAKGKTVAAPRVTAFSQAAAHVSMTETVNFVSWVEPTRQDVLNRASYEPTRPKMSRLNPGVTATVSGRKLDQGVLSRVVLKNSQLLGVSTVNLDGATVSVPELAECEVAGEWLIPNDGALIVSLGTHTTAGKGDKPLVHERVALIQATATNMGPQPRPEMKASFTPTPVVMPAPLAMMKPIAAPMPAMPSRHLPEPKNADGEPVALPPLPISAPVTMKPGTSEPCATPQVCCQDAKGDSATVPAACAEDGDCCEDEPVSSAAKTFSFRLPTGGFVKVGIQAHFLPATKPSASPKPD